MGNWIQTNMTDKRIVAPRHNGMPSVPLVKYTVKHQSKVHIALVSKHYRLYSMLLFALQTLFNVAVCITDSIQCCCLHYRLFNVAVCITDSIQCCCLHCILFSMKLHYSLLFNVAVCITYSFQWRCITASIQWRCITASIQCHCLHYSIYSMSLFALQTLFNAVPFRHFWVNYTSWFSRLLFNISYKVQMFNSLFVWGTTLYIFMSTLPFGCFFLQYVYNKNVWNCVFL